MSGRILRGLIVELIVVATLTPARVWTQPTMPPVGAPDGPAFAVSSIRPSGPDSGTGLSVKFLPGGRFVAKNANVRLLIKIAYNLNDDQVSGGPAWIGLKRFDVDATMDTASTTDSSAMPDSAQRRLLLQRLLRDRFQLKLRSETKEMSTFALVVAKNGPKLTKSATPEGETRLRGSMGHMTAENASMDQLAAAVEDSVGHPVRNLTGLDGRYDFKLDWTPDQGVPSTPGNTSDADYSGPTIFTALQQQLGLSLQARKAEAPCVFVESVELPSEN